MEMTSPSKMAKNFTTLFSSTLREGVLSIGSKPGRACRNTMSETILNQCSLPSTIWHRLGYVHCDVKPHNVLLVKEGVHDRDLTAKLADFGSVKSLKAPSNSEADKDREGESGFHGTYLYAAPESIAHLEYLPESDVWAVGCCVLHLLTGESPWKIDQEKDTAMDILFKIGCSDRIPEIPKRISKEARDFLMRCFVKDPRGRCRADALLQHPFVAKATGSCSSHHHHHHHFHLSARRIQSMLVPHCFHPVHAM